ncbi:hypothetical protein QE152_g25583 [Popillia japonica]|uniref:Gustatory receptor n=1 Tax=Popillia japonica TaxID=7064 RepID=A0AAW1K011_POPJA
MDIKRALLKRYRQNKRDLCWNCTTSFYFKVTYFIGLPISSKCTHANPIRSEYYTPIVGIIGSILCGVILLIGSTCELITSYNSQQRFWDLENLRTLGIFVYGFTQSLVILCLTKHWKDLRNLMISVETVLNNLSAIATKFEILEILLYGNLLIHSHTIFSIFVTISISAYLYWDLSRFDIFMTGSTFAFTIVTMGLGACLTIHHLVLKKCYSKLRGVLGYIANEKDDFRLVAGTLSLEAKLDLIRKVRSSGYESLRKASDLVRMSFYAYILGNMLALSQIFCVVVLRLFYGEFFAIKDDSTFLVLLLGIISTIPSYTCHKGENIAKEEELMLSYIYRYPTLKLSRKARAKNFSDYIRLAVYPYMLGNMFGLSEIFCVVLLRVFYGEFFGMKDDCTFLIITSGLKCVIASYVCHVGENMAKEDELMLSYIYRYPTLKLSRKARAKVLIHAVRYACISCGFQTVAID